MGCFAIFLACEIFYIVSNAAIAVQHFGKYREKRVHGMVGIKAIKASGIVGNILPKNFFDNPLVGISFCTIEQELNARYEHLARTIA